MKISMSEKLITPDIVRAKREVLGWSTAELATQAGLSEADVLAFEAHKRTRGQLRIVAAISNAFAHAGENFPDLPE